jgi:predicted anti-sigma-YlaC factor YlaD
VPEDRCELVQISAMAARDGETPPLPAEQVAAHLRQCAACRRQVEQLQDVSVLLDRQVRVLPAADLQPRIVKILEQPEAASATGEPLRQALPVLALLLLGCKAIACTAGLEMSLAIQVVPLAMAGITFAWLKANPLVIEANLEAEGAIP